MIGGQDGRDANTVVLTMSAAEARALITDLSCVYMTARMLDLRRELVRGVAVYGQEHVVVEGMHGKLRIPVPMPEEDEGTWRQRW